MKESQSGVYPKQFERYVKIRDGTRILLRPIKPEDADMWVELYNSLSSMSKYYRFFTSNRQPTPEMIEKYTNIDYVNDFAIVAILEEEGHEKMLGVARFILDPPPDSAELAVVIEDAWQSRGLGTKMLLHLLDIMIKRKIKKVHGAVFLENRAMMRLMHESGFNLKKEDSYGVRHFRFQLMK